MFSRFGAVRVDENVPKNLWTICRCSGQVWFDPSDGTYAFVLEKMLGRYGMQGMNVSNVETLGGILEAFFGLCCFMEHPKNDRNVAAASWKVEDI